MKDLLWAAASDYTDGRSAKELATILGRVARPREYQRPFARAVVTSADKKRSIEPLVEYIGQLHEEQHPGERAAVEAVGTELEAFATPPGTWSAEAVATIAAPLYVSHNQKLSGFGEKMLKRYLASGQHVTADDVKTVVERLRDAGVDPKNDARCFAIRCVAGWGRTHRGRLQESCGKPA
ncbi:hypothetical protein [Candidatus Frankia alpina]|nr:hypothetical protein [Candidatus Frankia alpina]